MAKPIETRYCENCNKPVSRDRKTCQNCGTRLKRNMGKTGCALIAFVLGIVIIVVISLFKYISSSSFDPEESGGSATQQQSLVSPLEPRHRV